MKEEEARNRNLSCNDIRKREPPTQWCLEALVFFLVLPQLKLEVCRSRPYLVIYRGEREPQRVRQQMRQDDLARYSIIPFSPQSGPEVA